MEDCLQDAAALYGFIEGYRLAYELHRELAEAPPYSFDREQEQQAAKLAEEGRGTNG